MTKDSILSDILTQLWLDESEIKVFEVCYQHGSLSVASIARMLWLSRSTVHGVVARLEAQEFLTPNHFSTTTLYDAISYDQLVQLVQRKQVDYVVLLSHLQTQEWYLKWLYQTRVSHSLITYYTAQELNTIMYDKILLTDHVRSIRDMDRGKEVFGLSNEQVMQLPRVSPWVTQRILVDSPLARKYVAAHQSQNYQLKLVAPEKCSKADLMIMDGSVYHGSYGTKKQWFQVTDPAFYGVMCEMFDALWVSLEFPKNT